MWLDLCIDKAIEGANPVSGERYILLDELLTDVNRKPPAKEVAAAPFDPLLLQAVISRADATSTITPGTERRMVRVFWYSDHVQFAELHLSAS